MASIAYAIEATTGQYDATALGYIMGLKDKINPAATILGISAAAIAGAMAEENHDYAHTLAKKWLNDGLDQYAKSGVNPVVFAAEVTLYGLPVALANYTVQFATGTRTHAQWAADYDAIGGAAGDIGHVPSELDKALHPVYIDLGHANFKMSTAIRLLNDTNRQADVVALSLDGYKTDYAALARDLIDPAHAVTAKLYGLMLKEAQTWFESHSAWGSNWAVLPQEFKDALYITYANIGPQRLEEKYTAQIAAGKPYEPMPGLGNAAGMNHLANAVQIGTAIDDPAYASTALAINITGQMTTTALENSEAGLAYRYALTKLNSVALVGIDYAAHNADGELDLYHPASGTGSLTDLYLADRAAMLAWKMQFDTTDKSYSLDWNTDTVSGNWDFIDQGTLINGSPLQLAINGRGVTLYDHQIIFGDSSSNTLTGSGDSDHLYGGGGGDTLTGNAGDDYLEGGTGADTYLINPGDDNDTILDTDGQGSIVYNGSALTGGTQISSNYWRGANNVTYSLLTTGSSQDLLIDTGAERLTVKDFAPGELGIALPGGSTPPSGQSATGFNIYGDLTPYQMPWDYYLWLAYPTWPYLFDVNGNLVHTTVPMPYFADKIFDSTGDDNIYAGHGLNVIYATNGGNNYIESGANDDYIIGGSGRDVVYSGGMSDTIDVAGGNDIVYGADGGDVVEGGAGDDYLVGGSGADALNGGDGNDQVFGSDPEAWQEAVVENDSGESGQGELSAGGDGNDLVVGSQTNDALLGGAGQDQLAGRAGDDILLGDSGLDFAVPPLSAFDTIIGTMNWPIGTYNNFHSPYTTAPMLNIQFQRIDHGVGAVDRFEVKLSSAANPEAPRDNWAVAPISGGNDELYGGAGDDWLFGEFGDDTLVGGSGNDVLVGGVGSDTLFGGENDDILVGGAGNDTLLGGAGDDTYIFNVGDGNDIIVDNFSGGETNTLLFGAGFDPAQVTLFQGSLGLDLGNGDIIHIEGVDYNDIANTSGIQRFVFADGTVLTAQELVARGFEVNGGSGDDTLQGTNVADRIDGGAGNDTLQGGAGNDVYLFGRGSGQDTIIEHDATEGNLDTLRLAAGIAVADVALSRDDSSLYLEIGGTTDKITVQGWFDDAAKRVEQIQFADGTVWDVSVLQAAGYPNAEPANRITGTKYNDTLSGSDAADLIEGGAGNDTINGGAGNDLIVGGAGSDVLAGGAGDDVFRVEGSDSAYDRFQGDDGFDVVQGGDGDDTFRMNVFNGINTVERIDGGAGVNVISGTQYNDTLNLAGTELVNIASIDGGAGNDTITGSSGNDLIVGGAGSDVMAGGAGDDVFRVEGGDSAYDRFQGDDGDDLIQGGDGDDTFRMNVFNGVNTVERIDGGAGVNVISGTQYNDTLNLAGTELVNIANIEGGAGNDTITGSSGNDLIIGGAGSDVLAGGAGDDVFSVEGGDSAYDRFQGDDGDDLIQGGDGDDTFRMNVFNGVNTVERIDGGAGVNVISGTQYNDTLNLAGTELLNIANIEGGAGNDTITGSSGNDLIIGGAGSDVLAGGAGDDVFRVEGSDSAYDRFQGDDGDDLIQGGDGDDTFRMNVFNGANTVERIDGGAGVNVISGTQYNDTLNLAGTELVNIASIEGGAGNDTITGTADNDLLSGGDGADVMNGAAGNDGLRGDAGNDTLTDASGRNLFDGGAGQDILRGGADNELFIGGAGNDTLTTGGGADIIAFNLGDGQDNVLAASGAANTLSLGGGITYGSLSFSKSANNLILTTGVNESITFQNWYASTANRSVLTLQVISESMAGYAANSSDSLFNRKVQEFDFLALVNAFDAARTANPALTGWGLATGLQEAHLASSDALAVGGDLAYRYGMNGTLAGISWEAAQEVIGGAQFGGGEQALRPWADLIGGV